MTEPDATTLEVAPTMPAVVRGTMQDPWSDYSGRSYAAGGPLLESVVQRLGLGAADRVLIVGPHSPALVSAVAAATDSTPTVLVRGTPDATALASQGLPAEVVAGSLDGFVESAPEPFSVVVALDGLDRVLSYDSEPLPFDDTLRLLLGLATPDARVAFTHAYDAAPVNVLDARPAKDRHGDDEFRAFHADPTRPTTAEGLLALVATVTGDAAGDLVAVFGPTAAPRLLASGAPETLDQAPPAITGYAIDAAHAHRRPLLAQPDELIRTLARGRRLADAADGGLVLLGTSADFDLARVSPDGTLVIGEFDDTTGNLAVLSAADVRSAEWPDDAATEVEERDTAQPSETAHYLSAQTAPQRDADARVDIDPELVPPQLHLTATVEDLFVDQATAGDVPAFRELAQAVGAYVQSVPVTERRVITFDNLHVTGRDFAPGADGARWTESVGTTDALAAAFWLLQDRLRREHVRQPWPDHVQGEALVGMWVEMASGAEPAREEIAQARALADAIGRSRPQPSGTVPDLRTAFADAAQARRELAEAQGHIFGLERTIGFRDKQLRTREQVIRNMRPGGGGGAGAAAAPTRAGVAARLVKRTAQVRSFGELTAGVDRVVKRAQRTRAAKNKK
ncbi:hypothetical protein HJ588_13015 [Flexivirga sp. ID2601S]|uniref:Uncharacterized protein n=1 Tax=Flexivirga aerilata TaxID=1656889 RepID=A0A849AKX9_9MICO|nr:hypothetical protein [Flexivirga aerilata]NNG40186.1 hypothetical protein [Flexivirga aerilata]